MADGHPLSAEVAALMQAVAARVIEEPGPGLALVDAASLAAAPQGVRVDPTLAASMQAATKANLLHWLGQVLVDPGVPVPPALSREGTALARDLVRRGLDAGALDTYRAGQNAAWQLWMDACFTVTDDPRLLHELLAYSAQSIFRYVDATMASISALVERERESLTQNTRSASRPCCSCWTAPPSRSTWPTGASRTTCVVSRPLPSSGPTRPPRNRVSSNGPPTSSVGYSASLGP